MKFLRRDWTGFLPDSFAGRLLRLPFRLIPDTMALPIMTGPSKGAKWVVSTSLTSCWLGTYELSLQKMAEKYIYPGMTVCDVGAHVGFFSLMFARLVGDTGLIHAFEPHPGNSADIRRHMDLNSVRNVRLWQLALSDTVGYAGFRPSVHSSMGMVADDDTDAPMTVELMTLDDLVLDGRIDPPDIVKVDIEGHELRFLRGARETIGRYSPLMFIEVHSAENGVACRCFLEDCGYTITDMDGGCDGAGFQSRMICALPPGKKDDCR